MAVKDELLAMGRIGRIIDSLPTAASRQRVVRYCVSVAFDKEEVPEERIVDQQAVPASSSQESPKQPIQ